MTITDEFKNAMLARLIKLEGEQTANAIDALVMGDKKAEAKFNDMACGVAASIAEVMREMDDKRWTIDNNKEEE